MIKEIERKWLLKEFPKDLVCTNKFIVEQSYLSISPEVRIVRKIFKDNEEYELTIKGNGDIERIEIPKTLTAEEYLGLKAMTDKPAVIKLHKTYNLDSGNVLEVSEVDDKFIYAEIEFINKPLAISYSEEFEYEKEITYDNDYKMKNYWNKTRIEEQD